MQTETLHIILTLIGLVLGPSITVLLYRSTVQRKDKEERDKQHQQNRDDLEKLERGQMAIQSSLEILPPHGHTEMGGPLHAEGIYRPRNR